MGAQPPHPIDEVRVRARARVRQGEANPNPNPNPNPSPNPSPNPNPNPKQDCVGGLSVRLQFNQEERWTTAFKCLLQDLKWLQAWHAAA